jgi:replication initiation protein RepC
MSISLAHQGLPVGMKPWQLIDLVRQVSRVANAATQISRTALAVLEHYIAGCRDRDFIEGSICGVWEQPSTLATKLGISTKVLHNAEAELRAKGWIERTSNAHARRRGERRDGAITSLAGISLAPTINRYHELIEIQTGVELHQKALADLRAEISQIRRQIRELSDESIIDQAEDILPRGRTSRIGELNRLEAIKADLEALLVLADVRSGDTKTSHRTEEMVTPNIPKKDSYQNRSGVADERAAAQSEWSIRPDAAARLASDDYQALLAAKGGPSWSNLIEVSATACGWLGVSQNVWGSACQALGRERAALCVLIIDRNWRLPEGHRYHRRRPLDSLRGMTRKGVATLNLHGLLRAIQGYPEGADGNNCAHQQRAEQRPPTGAKSLGGSLSIALADLQKRIEEAEEC